jgi:hypothetical protein
MIVEGIIVDGIAVGAIVDGITVGDVGGNVGKDVGPK